jgi:hypothetical protein
MLVKNSHGIYIETYHGSKKEKEIKRKFFNDYDLDPDKKENEKAYLKYRAWYINNKKWERCFKA